MPAGQKPYLYREIFAQPQVLTALLQEEQDHIAAIARSLRAGRIRYIVIAARGSSDNAALYGKYLFAATVGLPVALATPSLYTLYQRPPRLEDALVIGISQSGQSTDIIAVVEEAARQGVPTVAITNDARSPLAQVAGHTISLHAGEERSIAATKTYTAQLMALILLACHMAEDEERLAVLPQVPAAIGRCLDMDDSIAQVAERYRYMTTCVVIGRGYNYATAYEFALKLKELTYVMAEPYSSADFQHGPIAVITDGFPVFVFAPRGIVQEEIRRLSRRLRDRKAELVVFSDADDMLRLARVPVPIPAPLPEWLTPFTAIVLGQLFVYHLTLDKGYDPDHPRRLTKVTRTR
ncbi:MAG: SIS domain-containing protein [Chloroflexi bacterium]|nr:MAG: SIS domain-containing protein [Chloroflexota bacterium]